VNTEVALEDRRLCLPYLVECIRGHIEVKKKNRGQPVHEQHSKHKTISAIK
jgi:hypothetical protein